MDKDKEIGFSYSYSAANNKEIQEIRKRYLPQEESKMEELKRLDIEVRMSGTMESLIVGIGCGLVFGLGLCLSMKIIGNSMVLGILLGIIGLIGMLFAYPVYRSVFSKTNEKLTPRILQLTDELAGEKSRAF